MSFLLVMLALVSVVLAAPSARADRQNLDEALARKARYGQAHYSGTAAPHHWWQPETLCYTDTAYNAATGVPGEIWRLTFKPNVSDLISTEHGSNGWSADGRRIGFGVNDGSASGRKSSEVDDDAARAWVMFSDGTGLRGPDVPNRRNPVGGLADFGWTHTQPNRFYKWCDAAGFRNGDILTSGDFDDDNAVTRTVLLPSLGAPAALTAIKEQISSDDMWMAARTTAQSSCPECPNPAITCERIYVVHFEGAPHLEASWGTARGCGAYGDHAAASEGHFHDAWLLPSGQAIVGQYSSSHVFWEFSRGGSAADGGPLWESWNGSAFGVGEEIRCVSDSGAPDNPYGNVYWGHPTFDRWGRYVLHGTYDDSPRARTALSDRNADYSLGPPLFHDGAFSQYDGQHHSWNAWSDFLVAVDPNAGLAPRWIWMNRYDGDHSGVQVIASIEYGYGYKDNYDSYPRPSQSPDGTKVIFASVLFHSDYDNDAGDDDQVTLNYAVAYYPHPPEITESVATAGVVTVRFDWRLSTTPRGYTRRGWPDEALDDPPPPRETSRFRLWRSIDGSAWTPAATVDADIFAKYDFATGAWRAGSTPYWEITDRPGEGTFYYAVTAVEWSGLESRTLSNVHAVSVSAGAGSGSETAAYPAAPGAASGFHQTAPAAPAGVSWMHQAAPATAAGQYTVSWEEPVPRGLVRYYHLYAEDGAAPRIDQRNRIASIAATACAGGQCSWVDWLGNSDGSTQYAVTAVDTQGNESAASPPSGCDDDAGTCLTPGSASRGCACRGAQGGGLTLLLGLAAALLARLRVSAWRRR